MKDQKLFFIASHRGDLCHLMDKNYMRQRRKLRS